MTEEHGCVWFGYDHHHHNHHHEEEEEEEEEGRFT